MEYRGSNSMSNGMGNSMSNWVSNNSWMGNWVGNNSSLNNSWAILRNTFIGHILNNSISIVSIFNGLNSSIRESNSVATGGSIAISGFSLLEVGSAVVIIDSILVSIYWRFCKISSSSISSNYRNSWSCR